LPIVGMGGIQSGRDVLDLVAAGARHAALGTILFSDPDAPQRIRRELADELRARGYTDVDDAYSIAHAEPLSIATTKREKDLLTSRKSDA
jgi:dihydroorotate dehydrogenase (NAD+) catalytic subunit